MDSVTFWDKAAAKYARDPISNMAAYEATRERMRALIGPEDRVLELGCGTGSTALELAGGAGRYIASDLSPAMIAIAREKEGAPDTLTFEVRTAGDLSGGPFDVVIALNLLHLVEDLERTVAQIYEALPPGGLFISKTSLIADGKWFLPLAIPVMRMLGKAPFVRNLSDGEMRGILTGEGFALEEAFVQPDMAPRLFAVARKV